MSEFPPNLSIRPLTTEDLDQCASLEQSGFDEHERATAEKLKYRLTVCPELCSGLFIREYGYKYNAINLPEVADKLDKDHSEKVKSGELKTDEEEDLEELPVKSSVTKEILIGHIIGTKIPESKITDGSMSLPLGDGKTGHIENSRFIGIHSLVIDPKYQNKSLGTLLIHDYIQKLSNQDLGDKVSLIAKSQLVPFYQKIGFDDLGESDCKFAGTTWNDLSMDLVPEDDD